MLAAQVKDCQAVLPGRGPMLGGASQPLLRLLVVLGHPDALEIIESQFVLCRGPGLFGGLSTPEECLGRILWQASAARVGQGQVVLPQPVATRRRLPIPLRSSSQI